VTWNIQAKELSQRLPQAVPNAGRYMKSRHSSVVRFSFRNIFAFSPHVLGLRTQDSEVIYFVRSPKRRIKLQPQIGALMGQEKSQVLHDLMTKTFRQLAFDGKIPIWARHRLGCESTRCRKTKRRCGAEHDDLV
jgi:hypothetical protein